MSIGTGAKGGAEQAAAHIVFREVNERIAELTGSAPLVGANLFICECSRLDCAEALEVTADAYETVRRSGAYFLVLPGHEAVENERVVEENVAYVVVEKIGEARRRAIESDPRR